jgi:hypothetical protein
MGHENAPDDEHGGVGDKLVRLGADLKVNLAADGVTEVDLAFDQGLEGRGSRV